jgi:DNA-binding transcriptional ArsR family regulator
VETKSAVVALAALAQETRLSIFRLLVEAGPDGVAAGVMGETLAVPPATLSFHLKELVHSGMVSSRPQGRYVYYSTDFEQMAELMSFLTENCCQGMPKKGLKIMQTALGSCCAPPNQVKLNHAKSKRCRS